MKLLPEDWQLKDVPESESWACEFYEYARDLLELRDAADELRRRRTAGLDDGASSLWLARKFPTTNHRLVSKLLFEIPEFPDVPWKLLPSSVRAKWSREIPLKDETLDEDYDWLAKWLPPNFPINCDPSVPNLTGAIVKKHFREIGMVAFFMPERSRTQKDWLKALELWLEKNPEFCLSDDDRRTREKRTPSEWLKRLAVRRLKKSSLNSTTAQLIGLVSGYADGWLAASEQKWSDWDREALDRRHFLFGS